MSRKYENKTDDVIHKKVIKFGNGAHVLAPKKWIGDNVTLQKTNKVKETR